MVVVGLTAAGRTTIEHLFPRFNAEESSLASHLSEEQQDSLASMLRSLLRAVERNGEEGTAPNVG